MNILREVPLQKCRNVPEKKSYERSPTQSKVPQKISWIRFFKRKPFVGSSIRKSAREVLYKTSEGSSPKFPKKIGESRLTKSIEELWSMKSMVNFDAEAVASFRPWGSQGVADR
jgi:hypothetical protein